MAEKRRRDQNFTAVEKEKLLSLLIEYKETILCKKTDGTTNDAKSNAWISLTEKFNCSGTNYRNKESLMKLWEKLKSESKLYYSKNNKNVTATGGGPSCVQINPIMEQDCSIMGRGYTGILNVNDCDADTPAAEYLVPVTEYMVPEPNQAPSNEEVELPMSRELKDAVEVEQIAEPTKQREAVATRQKPLWCRRRRVRLSETSEWSEAVSTVCAGISEVHIKKKDVEDLKIALLEQELEFKRKLFELQLQAAAKELEIKNEILRQVKDGKIMSNLLWAPQPSQEKEEN